MSLFDIQKYIKKQTDVNKSATVDNGAHCCNAIRTYRKLPTH